MHTLVCRSISIRLNTPAIMWKPWNMELIIHIPAYLSFLLEEKAMSAQLVYGTPDNLTGRSLSI